MQCASTIKHSNTPLAPHRRRSSWQKKSWWTSWNSRILLVQLPTAVFLRPLTDIVLYLPKLTYWTANQIRNLPKQEVKFDSSVALNQKKVQLPSLRPWPKIGAPIHQTGKANHRMNSMYPTLAAGAIRRSCIVTVIQVTQVNRVAI